MCISPQSNRVNINNFFKAKEKTTKKPNQRENYNKISSNTRKLSSRNGEKHNTTKKSTHKRMISNNINITHINQFSPYNITSSNVNNMINKSHNLIFNNYNINSPQSMRHNNQDLSSNLFLNNNPKISNLGQNYFKISQIGQ